MVEWIEISSVTVHFTLGLVSTLVVEWIEIPLYYILINREVNVSTLVVEWIEITSTISSN